MVNRPSARSDTRIFRKLKDAFPEQPKSRSAKNIPRIPHTISISTEDGVRTLPMDVASQKRAIRTARKAARQERGRQDHNLDFKIVVRVYAGKKKVFEEVTP
ncbi:MAG: hypothetical protein AAB738_03375 [Patescibacteria group bacterium]